MQVNKSQYPSLNDNVMSIKSRYWMKAPENITYSKHDSEWRRNKSLLSWIDFRIHKFKAIANNETILNWSKTTNH